MNSSFRPEVGFQTYIILLFYYMKLERRNDKNVGYR
jgi:hypothetical protein